MWLCDSLGSSCIFHGIDYCVRTETGERVWYGVELGREGKGRERKRRKGRKGLCVDGYSGMSL